MPDPGFDASRPHIARVYDYLLGGKDNFAADRAVAEQIITQLPAAQVGVRARRGSPRAKSAACTTRLQPACAGPAGTRYWRRRRASGSRLRDGWALEFRRYRMAENVSRSRPGLGLQLEFAELVGGPLLLGQLSHFGYGMFVPDEGR